MEKTLSYADLDRKVIETPHGELAALFGLGMEFYIEPRERRQLRLDALDVQENYYNRFSSFIDLMNYVSATNPAGGQARLVKDDGSFQLVRRSMDDWPANQAYTNEIIGKFSPPNYLTPWLSNIHVAPAELDDELSYYGSCMTVADEGGKLRFKELLTCVLDWAARLRPAHGSAGFTVILEPGLSAIRTGDFTYETLKQYSVADILSAAPYTYETLQQYPGLDIHMPFSFISKVRGVFNRIKCVNWLTVLGDEILEELGGINSAQKTLESECILHPYPGGIVIQAGQMPRLNSDAPDQYGKVARFTRHVRFTGYKKALFRVFEPMNGCEEMEKWLKRFD